MKGGISEELPSYMKSIIIIIIIAAIVILFAVKIIPHAPELFQRVCLTFINKIPIPGIDKFLSDICYGGSIIEA